MIAIKRSCVTLFTAVICLGFISTDSAYQLVEDGNTFYANGNYQDARSMYERAEGLESDSAGIQYNLGNVHFKQFQLAPATESYKRVLLMGIPTFNHWRRITSVIFVISRRSTRLVRLRIRCVT